MDEIVENGFSINLEIFVVIKILEGEPLQRVGVHELEEFIRDCSMVKVGSLLTIQIRSQSINSETYSPRKSIDSAMML